MRPVIALVGRPNVGKSTLFNRLTRTRDAIVANIPGLTRDRQYGEGSSEGKSFIAIDTGGITGYEDGIDAEMASQSLQAIDEATICLFLVDARDGLTPDDSRILDYLRKHSKRSYLLVNKIDGSDPNEAMAEFFALGMKDVFPITATQGRGVTRMLTAVLDDAETDIQTTEEELEIEGIKIAIAGRPNVGKSTLVNRMLGEDRVVVYDRPGTTRDSVYIPFERRGKKYTLIDTAGIKRRGKTKETVEKFSVVKSLQAIQDANVVVLIVDARDGIVEQDLHLLGYVIETGRALVIAINKWDGMTESEKEHVKSEIRRRFTFVDFARIHFISALHGSGVGDLYKSLLTAFDSASKKLTTNRLTQVLQDAVVDHAPPIVNGRRIKLRYAHAGGHNPPTIVIHGKQTDKLPGHYSRYLEKTFRNGLKLEGTPVRIELRSDANPFVKGEQQLSQKQVARKRKIKKNRKPLKR
ncbi:MAG: ribosome biogenesis GTPase Der [Gammaproteobacteria bacterium]|jgi:GTP-binding protein|nr:ribosome biogenesis GTPase Der [Gammaproteobacteria bacterium]HJN95197.1 ribosome biogenesis GTPase Der [Gammaproteobacteria bacterium]|tara:strand:- start:11451 stop:12851 length:1401 start_codon:yes stop_codon:yes gene_type:complete